MRELRPVYWIMENPSGRYPTALRYRPFMLELEAFRLEATYCHYGRSFRKPTSFWTNIPVEGLRVCSREDPCKTKRLTGGHAQTAQHGPSDGTRGVSPLVAGRIPDKLLDKLFQACSWGTAARGIYVRRQD